MNATRPRTLVFVAGTATDIGKTWWTAAVAPRAARRRGAASPPASRCSRAIPATTTDGELLAAATGEEPDTVCPPARTLPLAWAPPMAAHELGLPPFTTADLAGGIDWPASVDVGLVEGVGGPRSPISADGDNVDLAHLLAPDLVVLVADAGLGTINAVRLSADALADFPVIVALNRYAVAVTAIRCTPATASTSDRRRLRRRHHAPCARRPAPPQHEEAVMTVPLAVGVPRERKEGEHRVAITPDGVHELVVHDVPVIVEHDAGAGSSISDDDFRAAGRRDRRRPPTTCGHAPTSCSR